MKRCLLLALLISWSAYATIDAYEFDDYDEEQRFRVLIDELRCPKCQNQNIADSNAGLAKDIKDRAYRLINEGKSNAEITDYMVERYGDFITYRPPLKPSTWFLWFGPFALTLLAAAILLFMKLKAKPAEPAKVDADKHKQVEDLLNKLED
ncbi:MAG: cytochrome c-type biogenesis protein CcmH [Pseudomonadales bacterium]|uniref:cytochrome c-type biogenesis protein n=1 Tax=unclassified Ketobacter TaxID=2639109 RepID=UPI000C645381|nr:MULTISPECIES: cytochrome c-type biogenesis protein [unclassified Ketobacter]MAA60201.1 cytochrome c-type biogenesis protein CcmH [Pseudomonadales bacterium]MEC8814121.1 cytochrome c-type biogenesis protein [Pseudomonadota bacterium]HAG93000.1 cytochrome c-type biogenesis protein CcmH [Gammaproteobacteria bacterium]MAQ25060.1 cytochrome c-type biogenesis protein CcmH [Pseudomonadales bacterium]MBI26910.1 cytochrome c-type biogenesis protein CcmH [Pseudomonadales bacterium]|tara:strand:+ start:176 stop:628 length:453 start_codon:yes stop_codon:yes gene_type:complete